MIQVTKRSLYTYTLLGAAMLLFSWAGQASAVQCCVLQDVTVRRYQSGFGASATTVGQEVVVSEEPKDCRLYNNPNSPVSGCSTSRRATGQFEEADIDDDPAAPQSARKAFDYFYTQEVGPVDCASYVAQVPACADILLESLTDCADFNGQQAGCEAKNECLYHAGQCQSVFDVSACQSLPNSQCTRSRVCTWSGDRCISQLEANLSEQYEVSEGFSRFIPACAYTGTCNNVEDLLTVVINITREVLGYIGILAFIFFLIGGATMIASFGNPERFKKGRQMLVAASIGLIIALSAFVLVSFILNAVGVTNDFRIL